MHILNHKEELLRLGGIEEEKIEFSIDPKITNAVIDELKNELLGLQNLQIKQYNFFYL